MVTISPPWTTPSAPRCARRRSASSSRNSTCCLRSARIADLLGITDRLDHRPSELSGGQQQRVALARALVNHPAIVLADEPTGNLDTENSEAVLKMLQKSNKELGQTVLMITHNPEAAAYASRVIQMRDGRI